MVLADWSGANLGGVWLTWSNENLKYLHLVRSQEGRQETRAAGEDSMHTGPDVRVCACISAFVWEILNSKLLYDNITTLKAFNSEGRECKKIQCVCMCKTEVIFDSALKFDKQINQEKKKNSSKLRMIFCSSNLEKVLSSQQLVPNGAGGVVTREKKGASHSHSP